MTRLAISNDIFFNFVRFCIPSKTVLIRPDDKPRYDSEIRKIYRKRIGQNVNSIKKGNQNILTKYIFFFRNKDNNLKSHSKNSFTYSRQVFIYLDPILIYISLLIDCLFEIRKIAVCFLWLSLPGDYIVQFIFCFGPLRSAIIF